jgi:hypothetical protein
LHAEGGFEAMTSTDNNKRTVGANITRIPIPIEFQQPNEFLQQQPFGPEPTCMYPHIHYMAVEGDKLVIRHYKSRKGAANHKIVVTLTGYWDQYEKLELEKSFDLNFLAGLQEDMEDKWEQKMYPGVSKNLIRDREA